MSDWVFIWAFSACLLVSCSVPEPMPCTTDTSAASDTCDVGFLCNAQTGQCERAEPTIQGTSETTVDMDAETETDTSADTSVADDMTSETALSGTPEDDGAEEDDESNDEFEPNRAPCPDDSVRIEGGITWICFDGDDLENGTFEMGNAEVQRSSPRHRRVVNTFWLSRTEVTFAQYGKCLTSDGPCWDLRNDPGAQNIVSSYGWSDAIREQSRKPITHLMMSEIEIFFRWYNSQHGDADVRLPSEAEWEYAARVDTDTLGSEQGPTSNACNARITPTDVSQDDENCLSCTRDEECGEGLCDGGVCQILGAVEVCTSAGTEVGPEKLCDMIGNVREWTSDSWHKHYNCPEALPNEVAAGSACARSSERPDDTRPWQEEDDLEASVVRGGGYSTLKETANVYYRMELTRTVSERRILSDVGFRMARTTAPVADE